MRKKAFLALLLISLFSAAAMNIYLSRIARNAGVVLADLQAVAAGEGPNIFGKGGIDEFCTIYRWNQNGEDRWTTSLDDARRIAGQGFTVTEWEGTVNYCSVECRECQCTSYLCRP